MSRKADQGVADVAQEKRPRSLPVAAAGVRTSKDFAHLMSSLMTDVIEGNVTPSVVNAAVNAGGKLLKAVELQLKYGKPNVLDGGKVLELCHDGTNADGLISDPIAEAEAELELANAAAVLAQKKLDVIRSQTASPKRNDAR